MDPILISTAIGAAVLLAFAAIGLGAQKRRPAVEERIRAYIQLEGTDGTRDARQADMKRKQIQRKLKAIQEKTKESKSKEGSGMHLALQRAGMKMTVPQLFIMGFSVGSVATLVAFMAQVPTALLPLILIGIGLGYPRLLLKMKTGGRKKKFNKNFADAVDVIVRGLRSGLPVQECLRIIGHEAAEPVAGEFRMITEHIKIGLTVDEAVARAAERMPTAEMKFFQIVIAIQQQTGGNLADVLEKVSAVLRGRQTLSLKIKALSSEANASAAVIGSLPFLVAGVLFFLNPEYGRVLIDTQAGNLVIAGGLTWMAIGAFVMKMMMNLDLS